MLAWFATWTDYFWRSPLANAKFTLVDFDGTEQAAAISREGKFVAFLADREGQIDAWIGEVGSGTYPQFDEWRRARSGQSVDPHARLLCGLIARLNLDKASGWLAGR